MFLTQEELKLIADQLTSYVMLLEVVAELDSVHIPSYLKQTEDEKAMRDRIEAAIHS